MFCANRHILCVIYVLYGASIRATTRLLLSLLHRPSYNVCIIGTKNGIIPSYIGHEYYSRNTVIVKFSYTAYTTAMFKRSPIYLDYAATTPVAPSVAKAMKPYLTSVFGNSGSVHSFGQKAVVAVDAAREQIATFLACTPYEVIFTSGATEANNLAVFGSVEASAVKKPHIITTAIEHEAVLAPCRALEKPRLPGGQERKATVTYLQPNSHGVIDIDTVRAAVTDDTVLVSIMYVNNETGAVQPIKHIGKMLMRLNKEREEKKLPRVLFHTDAVQAANFYDLQVDHTYVDLLSLSGHKIYGPKGIGVLYVREHTPLSPQTFGGGQQHGLRSGTVPVPLAVGMGHAVSLISNVPWEKRAEKFTKLRSVFIEELLKHIPIATVHGDITTTSPAFVNVYIPNVDGIALMTALDLAGVAVSLGAACSTGALKESHVLKAMHLPAAEIKNSLRFSFGRATSVKDVKTSIKRLHTIVEQLNASS